jgi:hypothetical protein
VRRKPSTNSHEGGDVLFECTDHRFTIRNGNLQPWLGVYSWVIFHSIAIRRPLSIFRL